MEQYTSLPFEEPEVTPFMEQTNDVKGYIKVPVEITRLRPFLKRPFFEVFNSDVDKLMGLPTLHMQVLLIIAKNIKTRNISYIKRKYIAQECDVLDDSITQALRSLRQRDLVHKCSDKCPHDDIHHRQGIYLVNPYILWRFDKFVWDKETGRYKNIYKQACEEWEQYNVH